MKIIAVINATKAVGDISLSLNFAFHVNKFVFIGTKQIITIEFMFAGINMFWARLRLILARAARRGLK